MVDVVYPLEDSIFEIVRQVERNCKYGVLPKTVQARLHLSVAEQTVRRYMVRMWESGKLLRVGGRGARRGYRLPPAAGVLEREVLRWKIDQQDAVGLCVAEIAAKLGYAEGVVSAYFDNLADGCR